MNRNLIHMLLSRLTNDSTQHAHARRQHCQEHCLRCDTCAPLGRPTLRSSAPEKTATMRAVCPLKSVASGSAPHCTRSRKYFVSVFILQQHAHDRHSTLLQQHAQV